MSNVLSQEELIKRIKEGDSFARDKLIEQNIPLVWSVVKKFNIRGIEVEDLFQIGCVGLIKAVDRFDTKFNVKFSTYAVPMIIGEIKRFLRDDGKIKISRKIKESSGKIKKFREDFVIKYEREPSIIEIAENLGMSTDDVVMSIESQNDVSSLNDVINEEDGKPITLLDMAAQEDYSTKLLDLMALKDGLNKLKGRERYIIFMRYFKNKTQSQIAEELNISQVHVSRIEKKALEKIKKELM